MSFGTWYFRRMCTKSDTARDAGLETPPEIERFDDIIYGSDKIIHVLDVYRPVSAEGRLPVIVSFHGGGWVYGSKEVYQFYCMELARHGFAVVNYNYRLAPKYKFPAPLEDTNGVFSWLLGNAGKYGFDTDNIFAVGDSAGAMGIALYACILTNGKYAAEFDFKAPEGLKLKGLALNCGVYTAPERRAISHFLPRGGEERALRLLNVTDHITAAFPPSFIMTAVGDFLKDQPEALMKVLDKYSVKYRYMLYGTEENPLGHVFHCNIRLPEAVRANDDECAFFGELMG